jgi:hypothetical protein
MLLRVLGKYRPKTFQETGTCRITFDSGGHDQHHTNRFTWGTMQQRTGAAHDARLPVKSALDKSSFDYRSIFKGSTSAHVTIGLGRVLLIASNVTL